MHFYKLVKIFALEMKKKPEFLQKPFIGEYFLNCVSFDRSGLSTSKKGLTNVSSKRQSLI